MRRVDPDRIYVFGHSNGGFMAYWLACELSDEVTAIAVLAGSDYPTDADCQPSRPVSVLHLHGDDDELVFYEGGSTFGEPVNIATSPYPGAAEVRDR